MPTKTTVYLIRDADGTYWDEIQLLWGPLEYATPHTKKEEAEDTMVERGLEDARVVTATVSVED
jgi:hypothetical protein